MYFSSRAGSVSRNKGSASTMNASAAAETKISASVFPLALRIQA
jgi:hypothetical protein